MAEQNPPQPGDEPYPNAAPQYGPPDAGAPVPPGAPYAAPGAPVPPGASVPPGAPYEAPGEPVPPKKSKTGKILGIVGGILALLLILCLVGVFFIMRNADSDLAGAKVDQCLAGDEIKDTATQPNLKVVDCGASDARYKIVGKLDGKTMAEANDDTLCQPYVDKGAEASYWQEQSRGAGKGPLFCLAPAK